MPSYPKKTTTRCCLLYTSRLQFPEDFDKVSSQEVRAYIWKNNDSGDYASGNKEEEGGNDLDDIDNDEAMADGEGIGVGGNGGTDVEAEEAAIEQAEVNICPILLFRKTQTVGIKSELEKRLAKAQEIKL